MEERVRAMYVELLRAPTAEDWMEVKRRALVTVGKNPVTEPDGEWKRKILRARHSPIRYLMYSYYLHGVPYWVSVHLVRHHVGVQPYVRSQRNDRQSLYDRNAARQDEPVDMIWDVNAEALITISEKRLCNQAAAETLNVVKEMCKLAKTATPEIADCLKPVCAKYGVCYEMYPCGRWDER